MLTGRHERGIINQSGQVTEPTGMRGMKKRRKWEADFSIRICGLQC